MENYKLGEMEQKFADIIWSNAPLKSSELVTICASEFSWKRTTTYTMLKRLCDRKIFENDKGMIKVLMTKSEFGAYQGEQFLSEAFSGSLPAFITAFSKHKKLNDDEISEIQRLIDEHKEG